MARASFAAALSATLVAVASPCAADPPSRAFTVIPVDISAVRLKPGFGASLVLIGGLAMNALASRDDQPWPPVAIRYRQSHDLSLSPYLKTHGGWLTVFDKDGANVAMKVRKGFGFAYEAPSRFIPGSRLNISFNVRTVHIYGGDFPVYGTAPLRLHPVLSTVRFGLKF